jgi:hypothetical protein
MNDRLMYAIMAVFIMENIRGEDQLKELMFIYGNIEESLY